MISVERARNRLTTLRIAGRLVHAAADPTIPLLAQIVVSRRCNISCGYCYEHDRVSEVVPYDVLVERLDHLKRLRVLFTTLNGGEPLLHPRAPDLVRQIRARGMVPMMNSNGLLLDRELIRELGRAGLYGIQISCDGLNPTKTTVKVMRALRPKLELLREHATFKVRINAVLGSAPPEEAEEVVRIATGMGFDAQVSLIREASGAAMALDAATQAAYLRIRQVGKRLPPWLHDDFQVPLSQGEKIRWKCRSGARYFHIDEEGIVHLCQPRAGTPAKPLAEYTRADIQRWFDTQKPCSTRCPHAYAHIGSRLDQWRPQTRSIAG